MPGDYASRLTAGQIDTLVDFLLEQKDPSASASEAGTDQAPSDGIATSGNCSDNCPRHCPCGGFGARLPQVAR